MKNKLRVLRAERNLTQGELAKLCNLSRTTINSVENETAMPSGETIKKLSCALNVPASEIFFDLNVV